ncbi:MAG: sel1 repeat family protein [Acholeplasmatales bacterium]|nr:sel1 repeat family protein [Acholeplasmatales bacterium]
MWFDYKGWWINTAKEYLNEYRNGNICVTYNLEDAEKIYEILPILVKDTDIDQYAYGEFLLFNNRGQKDIDEALKIIKGLVNKGFVPAYELYGFLNVTGEFVPKNIGEGIKWFEKTLSEICNFAPALYHLGHIYFYGNGVPKNEAKGLDLIRKAALEGYSKAINFEGICYYNGTNGYPQDKYQAFECFKATAFRGNSTGLYNLANLYYWGAGCEKNYKKAYDNYGLAAAMDNIDAMLIYADMSITGTYVEKNIPAALHYLEKAAKAGNAKAMGTYGALLFSSKEAPYEKRGEARMWVEKGAKLGDKDSIEYLKSM